MMEEERLNNSAEEEFKLGGDENKEGRENGGHDDDDDDALPPLVEAFSDPIPEVALMFVSLLDEVSDLKNLRLVSTYWRDLTLEKWRKTAVFSLTSDAAQQALKHALGVDGGLPSPLRPTFTIYRFHDKPFRQYRLKEGEMFPPDLPAIQNELYFWEKCGPSLTYLNLPECFFKRGLYFEGLYWILSSCPNLEELNFAPYKYFVKRDHYAFDHEPRTFGEWWWISSPQIQSQIESASANGVGNKLKSLTISSSTEINRTTNSFKKLFNYNVELGSVFLSLIPNITTMVLTKAKQITDITEALCKQATTASLVGKPFIQLKKFVVHTQNHDICDLSNFSNYLKDHNPELKILEIRSLCLPLIFREPSTFRKTLKAIRENVEEIDFAFDVGDTGSSLNQIKPGTSFDFFNLRFPLLTKLSLSFVYTPGRRCEHYFSFDFGMLRGTPNLKYLHFGAKNDRKNFSVKNKLAVADLVKGKEQSWHRVNGQERRSKMEIRKRVRVEEEEPFLPHEEIILDKMEEFYFEGSFSKEAIRFLGKAMKNLKVLETILDDETFPVVFEAWRSGGKLRKVTLLMLQRKKVGCHLIAKQKEITPGMEIVEMVEPSRGNGWKVLD